MPPKVVAVYARRFEPQWLVDQLRENLSWVDGFAEVDDRGSMDPWFDHDEMNQRYLAALKEQKADWALVTAPDERWDRQASAVIRKLSLDTREYRYMFRLREMWTPMAYRVDGIWGSKQRVRMWPVDRYTDEFPIRLPARFKPIDIYHLKMIEPENRVRRAEVLTAAGRRQSRGFDYLFDETGLEVREIEPGSFTPSYRKYVFDPTTEGE